MRLQRVGLYHRFVGSIIVSGEFVVKLGAESAEGQIELLGCGPLKYKDRKQGHDGHPGSKSCAELRSKHENAVHEKDEDAPKIQRVGERKHERDNLELEGRRLDGLEIVHLNHVNMWRRGNRRMALQLVQRQSLSAAHIYESRTLIRASSRQRAMQKQPPKTTPAKSKRTGEA